MSVSDNWVTYSNKIFSILYLSFVVQGLLWSMEAKVFPNPILLKGLMVQFGNEMVYLNAHYSVL